MARNRSRLIMQFSSTSLPEKRSNRAKRALSSGGTHKIRGYCTVSGTINCVCTKPLPDGGVANIWIWYVPAGVTCALGSGTFPGENPLQAPMTATVTPTNAMLMKASFQRGIVLGVRHAARARTNSPAPKVTRAFKGEFGSGFEGGDNGAPLPPAVPPAPVVMTYQKAAVDLPEITCVGPPPSFVGSVNAQAAPTGRPVQESVKGTVLVLGTPSNCTPVGVLVVDPAATVSCCGNVQQALSPLLASVKLTELCFVASATEVAVTFVVPEPDAGAW